MSEPGAQRQDGERDAGDAGFDAPLEDQPTGLAAPNPSYTIARSRLAGSAHCLNCGTALEGPFCHYCGQPDRNFMRFFPALLREFLTEFLELDSRFSRTMKPLLFKPGRLTRDYLDGRRYRYTPPLRLYLFSSIVFFLLAAFLSTDAIQDNIQVSGPGGGGGLQITAETEEDLARVEDALSSLPPEVREQLQLDLENAEVRERERDAFIRDQEIRVFSDQPWHPEDNPVNLSWVPQSFNDWINEEIERSPEKAKRINENPRLIVREVFDILPVAMFVLLPVVALIFKFWYLFAKRYYIEHLILALHNHSFMFVVLILLLLLDALETFAAGRGLGWLAQGITWLKIALWVWVPVYLVGALRTVYRQNWLLTLAKGMLIGMSYSTLLVAVTTVVALVSFLLV